MTNSQNNITYTFKINKESGLAEVVKTEYTPIPNDLEFNNFIINDVANYGVSAIGLSLDQVFGNNARGNIYTILTIPATYAKNLHEMQKNGDGGVRDKFFAAISTATDTAVGYGGGFLGVSTGGAVVTAVGASGLAAGAVIVGSGLAIGYVTDKAYSETGLKKLVDSSLQKVLADKDANFFLNNQKIIYNSGTQTQLKSSDEIAKQLAVDVLTSGINQNATPKKIEINQVKNVGSNNATQTDSFAITNKSLIQNSLSSIFKTNLETNFNFDSFSSNNNYLDNSRSFNFNNQDFILTNPMDKMSVSSFGSFGSGSSGNNNSSFGGFGGFNFNSDAGKINSLNSSSTAYKAWDEFKFDDYKLDLKTSLKLDFSINKNIYNSLNNFGNATNHASPLAFDLDGDGIETTHAYETNIYFDIDNDNFAERVGWIAKDDGQLAIDKNLNGQIDNVTELFGDYRMSAWDELRLLDSNKDNLINSEDSQFS